MNDTPNQAGAVCTALTRRFAQAGLGSPRLEAELLTAHVLQTARLSLRMHPERPIDGPRMQRLADLCARRERGEPLAYLTGTKEFFGRDFNVAHGVLIPRPETELLVETALELCPAEDTLRFADICSGSGCLGVTLGLECPAWIGVMLELMPEPAAGSRTNADKYSLSMPVLRADLFHSPLADRSFDLIVSNPPYIAPWEKDDMGTDVLTYEPREALFSGENGLRALEGVADLAKRALREGGLLLMEHGWKQGPAVRAMLAEKNFQQIFTKKDLAGLDRVTGARI